MKRKYWVEASVATLVLLILLLVSIPQFLRVQIQSQTAALQKYIEDAVQISAKHSMDDLSKLHGTVEVSGTGPIHSPKRGRIDRYTFNNHYICDSDDFVRSFPELGNAPWRASDLMFVVESSAELKSTKFYQDPWNDAEFKDEPFVIGIKAIVGEKQKWKSYQTHGSLYIADVDEEGYYNILGGGIPFDSSNGLTSYGEFYADTTSIWPRTKAVIMDPPPPGEPDY
ncbi:hypothetical protein K8I31_22290, partial [bacterium]|nr:hypothetical protein [bacterium]